MLVRTWVALSCLLAACDSFAADRAQPADSPPHAVPPRPPPGGGAPAPVVFDAGLRHCPGLVTTDDQDGLDKALEEDAGFDPCAVDSDGDGCSDAAEYYLGGCDDPHNAVLAQRCYQGAASSEVSYQLPPQGGPWALVRLEFEHTTQPLDVRALEAMPQEAATPIGGDFTTAQPGSTLHYRIALPSQAPGISLQRGKIRVLADAQPVAGGELLILPLPDCPLVP